MCYFNINGGRNTMLNGEASDSLLEGWFFSIGFAFKTLFPSLGNPSVKSSNSDLALFMLYFHSCVWVSWVLWHTGGGRRQPWTLGLAFYFSETIFLFTGPWPSGTLLFLLSSHIPSAFCVGLGIWMCKSRLTQKALYPLRCPQPPFYDFLKKNTTCITWCLKQLLSCYYHN